MVRPCASHGELAAQLCRQPGSREAKVAFDGRQRDAHRFCRLFQGETTKEALLENSALAGIDLFEASQRIVELGERVGLAVGDRERLRQLDRSGAAAAATCSAPRSRVIDEQPPHDPRRHRQKVRAVAKASTAQVDQLEIRLMDERRGIQRGARVLVPEALMGDTAEMLVHERDKLVQRVSLPLAPALQELRNVGGRG